MSSVMILLIAAFFIAIGIGILLAFQLMSLSDLESDFINVYDLASQVNRLILPEYALQAILSIVYLFSGNWLIFVFSATTFCYDLKLFFCRQHLIDITEIFNLLKTEKSRRLFKLNYLVILLSITLLGIIGHSSGNSHIVSESLYTI